MKKDLPDRARLENCRHPRDLPVGSGMRAGKRSAGLPPFGKVRGVPGAISSSRRSRAAAGFIAAALACGPAFADEGPSKASTAFFDEYCGECHYEDQSGGLDLSALTFDPGNRDNFSTWVRVFDRVTAGE